MIKKIDDLHLDKSLFQNEALIAVAGCLVQAMYNARLRKNDAIFCPTVNWREFVGWIQNTDATSRVPFHFWFVSDGQNIGVEAHPRSFGGRDQTYLLKLLRIVKGSSYGTDAFLSDLRSRLSETVDCLGEPGTWKSIQEVAGKLINVAKVSSIGRVYDPFSDQFDKINR